MSITADYIMEHALWSGWLILSMPLLRLNVKRRTGAIRELRAPQVLWHFHISFCSCSIILEFL